MADIMQCSSAIALTPMAPGPGVEADLRDRQLFGMGMNSYGRARTRLNNRSAREGSIAEYAALRRTPTHGPTPTRDREHRGPTMETISWSVPGGFNFAA
jgi:hypothetical protein